jgi:hypothetical protein
MAVDEQAPPIEFDDEFEPERPSPASPTLIETLKAQRQKVAQERSLDVVVPGWNELLVLRLGPISSEAQTRLFERLQRTRNTVTANVDTLIAAFRSVLGRATSNGELVELVDAEELPVGLDERLAELLGLGPVRSAREVVSALFAGANSPTLAITAAAGEYVEWAQSAREDVDEEFLGES